MQTNKGSFRIVEQSLCIVKTGYQSQYEYPLL